MKSFEIKKGFTIVELLVVVSVIGILASIVYANFGSARSASRDDVRKADLKAIELALNLYKAQHGHYPFACDNASSSWKGGTSGSYSCSDGGPYIKGLVPNFLAELPMDPQPTADNEGYLYRVDADASDYKLLAFKTVEAKTISSYDDEFARCPAPSGTACPATLTTNQQTTYAVYSSGAINW